MLSIKDALDEAINTAVAEEREACAKECDEISWLWRGRHDEKVARAGLQAANDAGRRIRARGKENPHLPKAYKDKLENMDHPLIKKVTYKNEAVENLRNLCQQILDTLK